MLVEDDVMKSWMVSVLAESQANIGDTFEILKLHGLVKGSKFDWFKEIGFTCETVASLMYISDTGGAAGS